MRQSNNRKIVEILKKSGPLLSDEIIQKLCSEYKLKKQSATKALSRISDPVKRMDDIGFPHNKKFFYLEPFDYEQKNKLYKYCNKYNTAEGHALNALMVRDGICLKKYFPIVSGLPVKKVSNQKLFTDVISSLEKNNMILKHKDEYLSEECYYLYNKKNSGYSSSLFYSLLEDKVLEQLKVLFIKLNFTSTDSVKIRSESDTPIYGCFNWSLVGPCYLDGVKIGDKNGFLCCDIFLGGKLNRDNIKPILKKYNTSKSQRRNIRIIPAIFFRDMTKPLLKILREKGFLTISAKTFGGDELLILLEEVVQLYKNINNKSTTGEDTGKIIKKVFDLKLGTNNNMRGYLFNLIVKSIFGLQYKNAEMGKKLQHNHQKKEIDVYCEDARYRYIIECKSWSNFHNQQENIKKWVDEKYQFFIDWNKKKNRNKGKKELRIYFIISTKDPNVIATTNKEFEEYSLMTFYDRAFLDKIAKEHKQKEIRLALKCFD